MRVCVTGGAGFIGSHVVDKFLAEGWKVNVVDNFLTGQREFLPKPKKLLGIGGRPIDAPPLLEYPAVEVFEGSFNDPSVLYRAFDGCDWIIHMAANAEGRRGLVRPGWDIEQNTIGTSHVLEAMRAVGVDKIFYASSGSVYGNTQMSAIPEDCPFPTQTSLYGASKIAGEGLIGAYVEGYQFTGVIGRWMQAIGERYLHGHVIDFVRQLRRSPNYLPMLGDGQQAKSGLYVKDLAAAIWTAVQHHDPLSDGIHVYNIGGSEMMTVRESAGIIAATMGLDPVVTMHGETWPGDNPRTYLDSTKLRWLGWDTTVTMEEAVKVTTQWLLSPACNYL